MFRLSVDMLIPFSDEKSVLSRVWLAPVRRKDARDQVQHRGLARTVLTDEDEGLPLLDRECDIESEVPQLPGSVNGEHQNFLRVTTFTVAITAN